MASTSGGGVTEWKWPRGHGVRPDRLTAAFCLVVEHACASEGVEPSPEARRSYLELTALRVHKSSWILPSKFTMATAQRPMWSCRRDEELPGCNLSKPSLRKNCAGYVSLSIVLLGQDFLGCHGDKISRSLMNIVGDTCAGDLPHLKQSTDSNKLQI